MKRTPTPRNPTAQSGSQSSSHRYDYHKVLDNRKHPIHGLWRRNGKSPARIKTEHDAGRRLYTPEDIEAFCKAAFGTRQNDDGEAVPVTKNAQEFADYIRLLAFTGAREQEAIKLRWSAVDFQQRQLTIGSDADTKNRECRRVDFNPHLEAHLKDMYARIGRETSIWLFPSPQRGDRDERAKTFRESLLLVRDASKMPKFGFHDCRHHFVSYCVMSGIDFMTIARWAGHKDGGILIGKVYGHLSNEHAKQQALRVNFGPTVATVPQSATA